MSMRIGVIGAGGVGGNFGGRLAHAGEDVVFVARGPHLEAIQQRGLRLSGDLECTVQPQATDDPHKAGIVDVLLVAVKAWQVTGAARALRPMVGATTMVVPLQNGLEAPGELAAILGKSPVVGGLCATVSQIVEPGHVHLTGGLLTFGELDNRRSERVERLLALLEHAAVPAHVPADIHGAMWGKFALITAWSGIAALTRSPAGVWGTLPQTRELFEAAVRETLAVAAARDVTIDAEGIDQMLSLPDRLAPEATASMQRDIIDGRPSELEYQNGAVVRYGREAGVATPVHDFIYRCLTPLEKRARGELQF
jgi:2-dehydropantoate 2-reductase